MDEVGNLRHGDVKIEEGRRLVVTLPLWQIASFLLMAGGVIGSVWLTTHDLGRDVSRLSGSVDALVSRLSKMDDEQDDIDRRVMVLENENGKLAR